MRDRIPTIADSDTADIPAFFAPYTLQNTPKAPPNQGMPYPVFRPDYVARPFAGMNRFFRFTIPPLNETENPDLREILKIQLNNPTGSAYTPVYPGQSAPISAFVPNPAGMRYTERKPGIAEPEPPQIYQAGARSALDVVSSIRRRR